MSRFRVPPRFTGAVFCRHVALGWERLRGLNLRNRLVADDRTGDQLLLRLTGHFVGYIHGGLSFGSLLLPYVVSDRHHPLRVYAILETAVGGLATALVSGISWVGSIYAASDIQGFAGMLLRGAYCAALLMVPTMLMGASRAPANPCRSDF